MSTYGCNMVQGEKQRRPNLVQASLYGVFLFSTT